MLRNKVVHNLVAAFANKILRFNDKITHTSKRTTRAKLLSYLSSQAQMQGSFTFDTPFNRQQLADYLGVKRAAMSVDISKLRREGILESNRNCFTLHVEVDK